MGSFSEKLFDENIIIENVWLHVYGDSMYMVNSGLSACSRVKAVS